MRAAMWRSLVRETNARYLQRKVIQLSSLLGIRNQGVEELMQLTVDTGLKFVRHEHLTFDRRAKRHQRCDIV